MSENALTILDTSEKALITFDETKIGLIKRTVAKGATDDELALFLHQAQKMGLDPLAKQIHFQKYNTKNGPQIAIITGIDGYRLNAERTGCYAGSDEPIFEGRINYAGQDVPAKATVKVWKIVQGKRVPFAASVYWSEYVPDKGRDFQWKKMPHVMLAKCAEAAALRKAFPNDLSGAYIREEMHQANWYTDEDDSVIEGETTKTVIDIPEVIQPDEVKLTGRDDYEQHISPGDSRTDTSPQAQAKRQRPKPPTNGKASDPLDGMRKRMHDLGSKLHGKQWADKRPVIVADMTDGRTESSNELTEDELSDLIAELAQALNEKLNG